MPVAGNGAPPAASAIAGAAQSAPSAIRQIARGSGWTIAARWSVRAIGLVSTVILARLLEPADFGVIAMTMATVGFTAVFAQAGQNLAVIRHDNPTAEHFDTAWTMSVCGGALVALLLFAIAPLAAWYFHEPRVVATIRFLALAPLIEGFINVGALAGFQRSLLFHKDFAFIVVRKLSLVATTIPLALVLRSYWALAIGIVCCEVVAVAASYRMHPYRPRLRLTRLREIWSYSAWMQISAVGEFFGAQSDQIIVGGLAGTAEMGTYNVAEDLATAPTAELVLPVSRAVFPVYSTLLQDPPRLAEAYLGVLSMTAIIALSTGVGVALVASDMIDIVLGPKWAAAALLVPWLALGVSLFGVARSVNAVLSVTGNARLNAMRVWGFVALLAPAATAGGMIAGAAGVALSRLLVTLLFIPLMFYSVMRAIPVTGGDILARLWRPMLAALAMAAAVSFAGTEAISPTILRLLCNVGLGAAVFAATLLALWSLAGRPDGAERMLVAQSGRAVRRLAAEAGQMPRTVRRRIAREADGR